MKKNLMFLTLLISVLMLSVVSAGITGYLVRGSGIRDAGYTATLQKVEGTTAIVSVQTPSGTTEVVRIKEGKTTKVGDTEISASSLTKGTLFRRAGAEIELNPVPEVRPIDGSGGTGKIGTKHEHLIDYPIKNSMTLQRSTSRVTAELKCLNNNSVIVYTGFKLHFNGTVLNNFANGRLPIMEYSYQDANTYYLGFLDYNNVILLASEAYVYCAERELAMDAQTAHFPF